LSSIWRGSTEPRLGAHGTRERRSERLGLQSSADAIRIDAVSRVYVTEAGRIKALENITLEIGRGHAVAVVGPSGSGKSTLLHLVGGMDRPTAGRISVFGHKLDELSDRELTKYRAAVIGYVFQDAHLLPGLTALENVVAARLPWHRRDKLVPAACELLAAVGLAERLHHPPQRLSGGERQRVALARALLCHPPLLIADEPTGDLDADTTEGLLRLLESLRRSLGLTLLVATHDSAVAATADRIVRLAGGRVD
jgi:putative ABC transport system ATP-binding protein